MPLKGSQARGSESWEIKADGYGHLLSDMEALSPAAS